MFALISCKKPVQIIGSALLFAALGSLFPVVAQDASVIPVEQVEPLETPTGTVEDLQGLEDRTTSEWLWGVGGEYEAEVLTSEPQLQPNLVETEGKNRNWTNLNRGDAKITDTSNTYMLVNF